jgi:two-component system, chemotaxis family, protein-glutamate methylesterase/glutaminase
VSRIRVLVVDDSVVVRRIVTEALRADPEIEVVGSAPNGRLALARVDQLNPDVITMDIEMPEMDGLSALRELRKTRPHLPVIMFSTLTERAASATLDALSLGANDYVTKPTALGSPEAVTRMLQEQLVPKVKALAVRAQPRRDAPGPFRPGVRSGNGAAPRFPGIAGQVHVITIGVSTGGPNALAQLIPTLPATLPVPVLIVQHMPPLFTRLLSERLNAASAIRVKEATAGEAVMPGTVYIAPGDWHMEVARESGSPRIALHQGPPENSCRPAADVLFRSVAAAYGAGTLGVVLTGMGKDGLRGAETITEAGGRILAQDEATSVVWGMPGFVAQANLAEQVLPLPEIGPAILRRIRPVAAVREGSCL